MDEHACFDGHCLLVLSECFEEYVKIQSEILREEIEAEDILRRDKDLACE